MADLGGKTAFISAATSVVGRACATLLGACGARLCLADADQAAAIRLSADLGAPAALAIGLDARDEASWQQATGRCLAGLDSLDILVHCDSRFDGRRAIVDTPLEAFRGVLYGTGLAAWLGQKHAIIAMRAGGRGGTIVHVTSVLGRVAAADTAAVCAGSAGVVMTAKAAALECAKHSDGITVNTVLTTAVDGDDGVYFPTAAALTGAVAVKPDDVAQAVLFYATDGAAYMTGTELPVDGGFLSR